MNELNDPFGTAILSFSKNKKPSEIIVRSDQCEDDIIPVEVLFRTYKEMPEIEKVALKMCKGDVLDIGAGAGMHAKYLIQKGLKVKCVDSSKGVCHHLTSNDIFVYHGKMEEVAIEEKFDTILLLMNGIGIAKNLSNLESFLIRMKEVLKPKGQVIFDSSDVLFLYENEDGSFDINLNDSYYGDFKFQLVYKEHTSEWFEWLYVDYDNLHHIAQKLNFDCRRVATKENHYLAQLTLKS